MKAPCFFSYFGGKYRLASKLIALFPSHHCYVDVFGGAGNLLIQKPPSPVEVFNDIHSDIVNLFYQLRENSDAFLHKASLVPHSREDVYRFRDKIKTETDPLNRAVMYWSILNQSFSGTPRGWKFSKKMSIAKGLKRKTEKIYPLVDRLRDVSFENKDFAFILERYDAQDTFFYCDPPYLLEVREKSKNGYAAEMTTEDHHRLVDVLRDIQGKVMLSGYENNFYNELGWEKKTFETKQTADRHSRTRRTECVWMNYEAAQ